MTSQFIHPSSEFNGIGHVGLKAQDLGGLSLFYERTVGFRLVEQHEGCHFFSVGGGALFEIWGGGTSSDSRKTPALQSVRVCFLVARLEPVIETLSSRGLLPCGEIGTYLGTRWIHYTDPEGNAFGFTDMHG